MVGSGPAQKMMNADIRSGLEKSRLSNNGSQTVPAEDGSKSPSAFTKTLRIVPHQWPSTTPNAAGQKVSYGRQGTANRASDVSSQYMARGSDLRPSVTNATRASL